LLLSDTDEFKGLKTEEICEPVPQHISEEREVKQFISQVGNEVANSI